MRQQALIDELRSSHLAREDALPLLGPTAPIVPPPHIETMADMDALVGRYADLAEAGMPYRDWYTSSGKAILGAAGESPEMADKIAQGLAITSKATPVATNLTYAATAHNQEMLGDPIRAGRFPNQMGADIEGAYYAGEPLRGNKIEPFLGATAEEWNPNFAHTCVNNWPGNLVRCATATRSATGTCRRLWRRFRRRLAGHDDGDRQFVDILTAVSEAGLDAVEAACADALSAKLCGRDVVLNVLARQREGDPPGPVVTPAALTLAIEPAADCARYDRLRPPPLAEEAYRGAA